MLLGRDRKSSQGMSNRGYRLEIDNKQARRNKTC